MEYVIVWQSEARIEHYRRSERGEWILTDYEGDAAVSLPALGVEVRLAEVYDKVELLDEQPANRG